MPINDLIDTYVSIAYGYEISQQTRKTIYNFVCYMFQNSNLTLIIRSYKIINKKMIPYFLNDIIIY